MISNTLKFILIASLLAGIATLAVFSFWDTPVKQTPVEVSINPSDIKN